MTNEEAIKFIRFVDQESVDKELLKYNAGIVYKEGNRFSIGYEQRGAQETFSIGQPVYDKDKNIMGYLGIGLFEHLNYSTREDGIRQPVEKWEILLPTKFCEEGKKVYSYWQTYGELNKRIVTEVLKTNPEFKDVIVPLCKHRNGKCTEFYPCGKGAKND